MMADLSLLFLLLLLLLLLLLQDDGVEDRRAKAREANAKLKPVLDLERESAILELVEAAGGIWENDAPFDVDWAFSDEL